MENEGKGGLNPFIKLKNCKIFSLLDHLNKKDRGEEKGRGGDSRHGLEAGISYKLTIESREGEKKGEGTKKNRFAQISFNHCLRYGEGEKGAGKKKKGRESRRGPPLSTTWPEGEGKRCKRGKKRKKKKRKTALAHKKR